MLPVPDSTPATPTHPRRWFVLAIGIVVVWGSIAQALETRDPDSVKAACIRHFITLTRWPETAFATDESPLVIGVVGKDKAGGLIRNHDKTVINRRKIEVRYIDLLATEGVPKEVTECHLLYFASSAKTGFDRVLKAIRGKPILTVANFDTFAINGGMIELFIDKKKSKVSFRINKDNSDSAKVGVTTRLLEAAAEIVKNK